MVVTSKQIDMDNDQFFSQYDTLITDSIDQYHIPGLSIAVVDGDSTWVKGYGVARQPDEKVTPTTLFNVGSMTKALVAASISLLVDDTSKPNVQWSTPVSQLLRDDFVLSGSTYTEMVTVEDILSHRSGLPDQDDACLGIYAAKPDTPKSVTRKLRNLPLTAPLRAQFQYCNMMYVVACHLVETLTGTSIGDFVRQRITAPLGMENSYLGEHEAIEHHALDRLAKGYGWDEETCAYFDVAWPVQPEAVGAGEMLSTASDYARFLRCMIDQKLPISEEGHEELVKPRTIVGGSPDPYFSQTLYALGWETTTYHGEAVIEHSGSTSGFGSHMMYLPGKKWAVVMLGNIAHAWHAIDKIRWTLVDDLLSIPADKRFDWDGQVADIMRILKSNAEAEPYSDVPKPPIPLTLALPSYAGSYQNDGYGTLTVDLKDSKLEIDATDRTYRFKLFLKHVSGEFFAAERLEVDERQKAMRKAEFRLKADGSVGQFGVALIPGFDDHMIWFRRVSTDET